MFLPIILLTQFKRAEPFFCLSSMNQANTSAQIGSLTTYHINTCVCVCVQIGNWGMHTHTNVSITEQNTKNKKKKQKTKSNKIW